MLVGFLAGLALMASPLQDVQAQSRSSAQDPAESTLDDIVVQGRTVEQQARAYVAGVTRAPGTMRLAGWSRKVCVGVEGLDAPYAQFLVDKISALAASVGLDPGNPGCRPETIIAFSRDPDAVAQRWVERDLDSFRPSRNGGTDLGAEALERFKVSDAPIRWWHVSFSVNAQTGESVTRLRNEPPPPNYINTPSWIQSQTRESLVLAFIVVDADQIGQTSFGSLSDYLALVALTQVDPGAATGEFDTVLNLFSGQPTARLSAWDVDFLQALYSARTNPIRAGLQGRHIARALSGRRTRDTTTAPNTSEDLDSDDSAN